MKRVVMLAFFAGAGCAPRLYVNVLQPAAVNFGAAKKLTIYESQGRKSARDELLQELTSQARASGYFTVTDKSEQGLTVKLSGNSATLSGPLPADEVAMRVDV